MREKDFPSGDYGVIVVVRNGAKTIGSTLNSIMDQTLQPTILCVVDDGSTDDTARARALTRYSSYSLNCRG